MMFTVSIKSNPDWVWLLSETLSLTGRDVMVKNVQFECQNPHIAVGVIIDVSLWPALVGFLWRWNALYKFKCFNDNEITSIWSSLFVSLSSSWTYDVNALDSLLFLCLVFGVRLTGSGVLFLFGVVSFKAKGSGVFSKLESVVGKLEGVVGKLEGVVKACWKRSLGF